MIVLRYLGAWAFYVLGDAVSYLLLLPDTLPSRWHDFWYRPYNWLLQKSSQAQGDNEGDMWPWRAP